MKMAHVNGKLYVIGGLHYVKTYDSVDIYDIETGTWTSSEPNMPVNSLAEHCLVTVGHEIYVLGGVGMEFGGKNYTLLATTYGIYNCS